MKLSIVIIGIAMLVLSVAHSQNTEPTPLYFKCYNLSDSTIRQLTVDSLKQTGFVITSQWGVHPRMAEALKMTGTQGESLFPSL